VQQGDLQVAASLDFLYSAATRLSGTTYSAVYRNPNDLHICVSPDVNAELQNVFFAPGSWRNWSLGLKGLDLALGARIRFYSKDSCVPVVLPVQCNIGTCASNLSEDFALFGYCSLYLWSWRFATTIPNPFRVSPALVLKLGDAASVRRRRVAGQSSGASFEFGELRNDQWVSGGKTKSIPIRNSFYGVNGQDAANRCETPFYHEPNVAEPDRADQPCPEDVLANRLAEQGLVDPRRSRLNGTDISWNRNLVHAIVADAAIGDYKTSIVGTAREGEQALAAPIPIFDGGSLGVSLGPGLFGSAAPGRMPTGILGAALPIRMSGRAQNGGKDYDYEVFLTRASVMFTTIDGKPGVVMDLSTDKARVAQVGVVGDNLFQSLEFRVAWTDLQISPADGKVSMKLASAQVILHAAGAGIEFCIEPLVANVFNDFFGTIAQMQPQLVIQLPDCVRVDSDKVWAQRACRDFGNKQQGYASNMNPEKKISVHVQIAEQKTRILQGAFQISIPVTIE
jgi:hypothetical protein